MRAWSREVRAWKVAHLKPSTAFKLASSFLSYRVGKPRLTYVVYCCTSRCNLRCVFCHWWRSQRRELAETEAAKVIADLADFGVSVIDFSGGEPTLRRDLERLAAQAQDYGIFTILSTNGTLLDPERARALARVFDMVNVSLDGYSKTHDAIRGVQGTFHRALEGIKLLSSTKLPRVGVDATVFKGNIGEVLPLFKSLHGLVDFVSFQPILPYPPAPEVSATPSEAEGLVEGLLALRKEDPAYVAPIESYISMLKPYFNRSLPRYCDAGSLYAMIEPTGRLVACTNWPGTEIGDLTEKRLGELWVSERRAAALEATEACRGCLSQCTTMLSLAYRGRIKASDIKAALSWSLG